MEVRDDHVVVWPEVAAYPGATSVVAALWAFDPVGVGAFDGQSANPDDKKHPRRVRCRDRRKTDWSAPNGRCPSAM